MPYLYGIMDNRTTLYFDIIHTYRYFVSKAGGARHHPDISDRENVMISGFLDWIDKQYTVSSVGVDFLYWFFSYQIHFYVGGGLTLTSRNVLSWLIGSKARQRWLDRNPHTWKRQISEKFSGQFSPNYSEYYNSIRPTQLDMYAEQEKERSVAFGTEAALGHCYNNTTMYEKNSKYCCRCKQAQDCITLQQAAYGH